MIISLHVKNLAIIDEAYVEFKEHLNILTGETGAGKSIIIDSINIALGAKVSGDIIRKGAEYALVELVFEVAEESALQALRKRDFFPEEDGQVIITRKIMNGRSLSKVNGESVTISALKELSSYLIDIHGQHEHQSLLYKNKHLEIVDRYRKEQTDPIKKELVQCYSDYKTIKKELSSSVISEEERMRELSFLEYEKKEIEEADLKEGEEERLLLEYRKYVNAGTIVEGMDKIYQLTNTSEYAVSEQIANAIRRMHLLLEYDERMEGFLSQLTDIEDMVNGLNRDISVFLDDFSFDEELSFETGNRLEVVHKIQMKYGNTYEKIQEYYSRIVEKLKKLQDYEAYRKNLEEECLKKQKKLDNLCNRLSQIRKEGAAKLQEEIKEALIDLNFLDVRFEIDFRELDDYSRSGKEDVEFILAVNPGEDLKSLSKIASGGELSRIMLAIKSILADNDSISTLVFDEIDTGISGRTAQKVSEKLSFIAKKHQVICITHLAQIAAMADAHFIIEKAAENNITTTGIRPLEEKESIDELARILGGAKITQAVTASAQEMKELADFFKNNS